MPCPAPLLPLAAAAARTRRITLGTTSYLLPVRHPIHAAEEVALLDQLCGGRLILGLGRGFQPELFAAFGVPAAEKRARFAECLEGMRRAWAGEPVDPGGARIEPRPLQQPHPPLWVAAFGPLAIEQAGRLGLPYLASMAESLERLEQNHARHRSATPASVDPAGLPVPIMRTVFISADAASGARVREALARQPARQRPGADDAARVDDWALVGEPARVADRIARYREALGITHLIAALQVPGASAAEIEASTEQLAGLR